MTFTNTLQNIKSILIILNEKKNIYKNIFLTTIGSILEIVGIAFIIPLIHIMFQNQDYFIIKYFSEIFSFEDILIIFMIMFLCFYLFKTIFISIVNYFVQSSAFRFQLKLSNEIYKIYIRKNYEFHLANNSSDLLKNIATESRLFSYIFINFIQFFSEILLFIILITFLTFFNFLSTVVVITFSAVIFFLVYLLFRNKHMMLSKTRSKIEGDYYKFVSETFNSIKTIKILFKENFFIQRFSEKAAISSKTLGLQNYLSTLPKIWTEFIAVLLFSLIVLISYKIQNQITVETFTLVAVYSAAAFRLIPSVNRIIFNFQFILNNSAGIEILKDQINIKADKIYFDNQEISFSKKIKLRNLNFSYNQKNKILNDLCLDINKNEFIGIKGVSGSGKTTLIDLISGLKDIQGGSITVDDKKIDFRSTSWRKKIGYITQKTTILDESIKKNIIFGDDLNNLNETEINNVVKLSKLDEFIKKQTNGINTIIGENGARISGGQVQRIGIARSLYFKPEILIMDEPTNSLDKNTEKEFLSGIKDIKGKVTIIMVSHSEITKDYCDSVYELIDGKLTKL